MRLLFIKSSLIFIGLFLSTTALAVGAGITYHGRLVDPNGTPVVGANVQFKIQIRTPGAENCLLYEEVQVKDLSQTSGVFSVTINDGTGTRLDSSGYLLDQIFANRGTFSFAGGQCAAAGTYTPNPSDGRKIQVFFNDGSFAANYWEPSPPMPINFIPMAIESMQIGGYKKEQLLKLADGVTTTGSELDSTKWTNLLALINGTSTAYMKPTDQVTQLYGASIPAPANGQSIRWNSGLNSGAGGWENFTAGSASAVTSVSSANSDIAVANSTTTPQLTLNSGTGANQIVKLDGTAKLPAVDGSQLTNINASKVGGTSVSLASLTNGQVLQYNGTNWVNATLTDNDTLGGLSCANGRVAYFTGGSWACLEVTSGNTINTVVSRDGTGKSTFGTVNAGTLQVNDGSSGVISLTTPVAVTSYSMKLPTGVGTSGYALTTDGGSPAQLSWSPMTSSQWTTSGSNIYYNSGNVGVGTTTPSAQFHVSKTSLTGGTNITSSGTAVTGTGTNFLSAFNVGDKITAQGQVRTITAITSNTSMTINSAFTPDLYGAGAIMRVGTVFNAGTVGIGTISPLGTLDIQQNSNDYTNFAFRATTADNSVLSLGSSTDSMGVLKYTWSAGMQPSPNPIVEFNSGTNGGPGASGTFFRVNPSYADNASSIFDVQKSGTTYFAVRGSGNVGVGTTTPQDKLDVNGNIRVAKNSAQPYACDAAHDAVIALTSQYTTCVCKGGSASWVRTTDGSTACTW